MRRFRSIYVKNLMIVALALALSFILLISAFAMISYSYIIREKTGDMEAYAKTSVNINGLLFRRHLQQGIDYFKVRAFEFRTGTLVKVAMRTFVAMLGAVRAMARLTVLFARTGETLGAVAGGVHRAVFARGAFFAAGHAHAVTATAAFKCSQEKSQGEGKDCDTCREEFVSVHRVTP